MEKKEIAEYIVHYLVTEVGLDAAAVNVDAKLVSTRLLDSINTLTMLSHLEEKFGFEANPEEVSVDNLDTPHIMADYILGKKG